MSEDDLFAQAMGQVQPLAVEKGRVSQQKPKQHASQLVLQADHADFRSDNQVDVDVQIMLQADNDHEWQRSVSGVSAKVLKKLALADIQTELDLHGLSQNQALAALQDFVGQALQNQQRQICIIHGKGLHSKDKPILKTAVYQWLVSGAYASSILAVVPAAQSKGGACHVLLRRSKV
ncbi:MAG: Smr/MutS family protein [Mariprofundaceae bacterium]|nr:Smr/MutS family protein [Mariprofundaceae bacterium]